jgi:hypothetical protein
LTRFQPSGEFWGDEGLAFFDMRFSAPVLVDYVQLAPGRTLVVVPEATDPALLHVTVAGPSFAPNQAQGNLTRVAPTIIVGIEMNAGGDSAPLWIPIVSSPLAETAPGPGTATWSGNLYLPNAPNGRAMRLTVKEYETLPADPPDRDFGSTALVNRLVFATSVPLTPEPRAVAREVTSVKKHHGTITHLCNDGETWSPVAVDAAVDQIRSGLASYVTRRGEYGAPIKVVSDGHGGYYLRTQTDQTPADNLANLPRSTG